MVEGSSEAQETKLSARKGPPGLQIQLPDDEQAAEKKAATTKEGGAQASGRVSARGAAEASGRASARGEGAKGRTSARGGLSSRGGQPKTVVCHEAVIKGNVHFGEGCIVHPGAQIDAEGGDIFFGDFNIIEEYAFIINKVRKDQQGNAVKRPMRIGSYNLFEVYSGVDSTQVGDFNEFGVRSSVGPGSQIGDFCVINPTVSVPGKSKVVDNTVYIDMGVISIGESSMDKKQKEGHIKEISTLLQESIPQHLKTQVKDANGKWQPVDVQPKQPASSRQGQRPGSKQGGGVSARGTGQASARAKLSARGETPGQQSSQAAARAKAALATEQKQA